MVATTIFYQLARIKTRGRVVYFWIMFLWKVKLAHAEQTLEVI